MAKRGNPEFFQVLICQIGQDRKVDVVFSKALSVLPETEFLKPFRNLLHRRPPAHQPCTGRIESLPIFARILQRRLGATKSAWGLVSRARPVHTAKRNCTRDAGGPSEVGNQVLISNYRKLLSSKATGGERCGKIGT